MNFFRNFLKVFWTKNARKLSILTKIRKKKCFKYFSQALAQKKCHTNVKGNIKNTYEKI